MKLSNRFEALQDEENEVESAEEKEGKHLGKQEIVVDSGAAESVCP